MHCCVSELVLDHSSWYSEYCSDVEIETGQHIDNVWDRRPRKNGCDPTSTQLVTHTWTVEHTKQLQVKPSIVSAVRDRPMKRQRGGLGGCDTQRPNERSLAFVQLAFGGVQLYHGMVPAW
jgi:hypothetical protein